MNTQMKRRLVVVTGIIVVVMAIVLAVVGSGGSARSLTVADAAGGTGMGERVQVTGNVVDNSYSTEGGVLTFSIYDPEGDPSQTLNVRYEGAASSTFGNGVTAICTGRLSDDGGVLLTASELVTKCPSKYESATDALGIAQLLGYGDDIVDKTVKITGVVKDGTLTAAGSDELCVRRCGGFLARGFRVLRRRAARGRPGGNDGGRPGLAFVRRSLPCHGRSARGR